MNPLTRRHFLAASAVAAAGTLTAPATAHGQEGPEEQGGFDAERYADVLDLHGTPAQAYPGDARGNNPITVFADLGAWHAYALPRPADRPGGFTGPLYLAQEYPWWLSDGLTRLQLTEQGSPWTSAPAPPRAAPRCPACCGWPTTSAAASPSPWNCASPATAPPCSGPASPTPARPYGPWPPPGPAGCCAPPPAPST